MAHEVVVHGVDDVGALCGSATVSLDGPHGAITDAVVVAARAAFGVEDVVLLASTTWSEAYVHLRGREGRDQPAGLPAGWADRPPWAQLGWYDEAVARVDQALEPAGRRRTGPARQAKHWSISALLQVPTDRGDVWFKETPPVFGHEGQVVRWLAQLVPDRFAPPLATGDRWWLAAELPEEVESPAGSGLDSLDLLHQVQLASVGKDDELLALGCPDRRLPVLRTDLAALCGREDLLSPERRGQLQELMPAVLQRIDELEEVGLPDTVVHGDFHAGNMRWTANGWVVYDWTDACLANPLLDLAPAGSRLSDGDLRAKMVARLAELWRAGFPRVTPEAVMRAVVVGAAHQAVSYQRIADGTRAPGSSMWSQECGDWVPIIEGLLAGEPS